MLLLKRKRRSLSITFYTLNLKINQQMQHKNDLWVIYEILRGKNTALPFLAKFNSHKAWSIIWTTSNTHFLHEYLMQSLWNATQKNLVKMVKMKELTKMATRNVGNWELYTIRPLTTCIGLQRAQASIPYRRRFVRFRTNAFFMIATRTNVAQMENAICWGQKNASDTTLQ